jgi:hypothetical protein
MTARALLAALAALTLAGLALHAPGAGNLSPAAWPWFALLGAASAVVWGLLVREILHGRLALGLGLAVALALRAALLPVAPFLSSDVNRYVWDGLVQQAGINPYLHLPVDPALAFLRGAEIYPHINRAAEAHTIYPPAAQLVFRAVAGLGVTGMKAAMVGFEAVAVLCLLALLRRSGQPHSRVLIYALNPVAIWSFAGNGHVDAIGIGLLSAAMLAATLWRRGLAGALFAGAVLTKFLPAVAFAALWRRGGWRFGLAALATTAALYAWYADAGPLLLGFLPGYGREEGLVSGEGVWALAGLAHLGALPPWASPAYALALALLLLALSAQVLRRPAPGAIGADVALLAAVLTVGISPHYPWYFAWLAALAVLRPEPWLLWLAGAAMLLHYDPFADAFLLSCLLYVPAGLLALRGLRPSSSLSPEQAT